jgi:hypothetical protein
MTSHSEKKEIVLNAARKVLGVIKPVKGRHYPISMNRLSSQTYR